jgi:hypothetical protein
MNSINRILIITLSTKPDSLKLFYRDFWHFFRFLPCLGQSHDHCVSLCVTFQPEVQIFNSWIDEWLRDCLPSSNKTGSLMKQDDGPKLERFSHFQVLINIIKREVPASINGTFNPQTFLAFYFCNFYDRSVKPLKVQKFQLLNALFVKSVIRCCRMSRVRAPVWPGTFLRKNINTCRKQRVKWMWSPSLHPFVNILIGLRKLTVTYKIGVS